MKVRKGLLVIALAAISGFVIGARAGSRMEKRSVLSRNPQQADSSDQYNVEYAAIEPLTPDILRKRITEMFSGGYLTLLAIIQGVAIGILLQTFQHDISTTASISYRLTVGAQALAVFVAIVIITHQYFLFTALVRWTPHTLDTLYPYLLGIGEVGSALFLGNNTFWWGAVSVQLIAGGGAYAYSLQRADEPVFGEMKALYNSFHRSVRRQAWICFALLVCSSVVAVLSIYAVLPWWFYALSPCAITAGAIVVPFTHDQTKDYELHGLPVWRVRRPRPPTNVHQRNSPGRISSGASKGTGLD